MRFSSAVFLALPLAAFAAEGDSAFDQYKAQFQNFLGSFGGKPAAQSEQSEQSQQAAEAVKERYSAEETPVEGSALSMLTLDNWKETLYGSIPEGQTTPEEWWLFVTGRNKTCNGYCFKAEAAFNETAATFSEMTEVDTPHMAMMNCDNDPVFCNSWGAGAGNLWIIDLLPAPSHVDIHSKRLNLSSVTSESIVKYLDPAEREGFREMTAIFHPFNSKIAELGLSVPVGYLVYYMGLIPNWMFMFGLSAISRTLMTNRMRNNDERRAAPAAAPAAN